MKSLRNFFIISTLIIVSFTVVANSLDEYAKKEAAMNIVDNEVLLSCKQPLQVELVWKASEVLEVTSQTVKVKTILPDCGVRTIISNFHYKINRTSIVHVSAE